MSMVREIHNRQWGDRGQILLITLLVLTVATTIALSLIGRATLDLSMSNQLEESTRAFDAAEAGIEQALRSGTGTSGPSTLSPGVTYDVSVNSIGGAAGVYQFSHATPENVTETIWLVSHTADGDLDETPFYTSPTIDLCWSQGTTPAALVVAILYREGTDQTYQVARTAVDPSSRGNNFDMTGITTNGCGLSYYRKVINFASLGLTLNGASRDTLLALRIRPIYADATLAVDGGAFGIPRQGNVIESTGSTATGITRKVIVYQQYRSALTVFDSVVHSQSLFGR